VLYPCSLCWGEAFRQWFKGIGFDEMVEMLLTSKKTRVGFYVISNRKKKE
jgi:hypothetical protein